MPDLTIKEGSTEPIEFTLSATGLADLTNLSSAAFYARKRGQSSNHVDGASMTVSDSANRKVQIDPSGNGPGGGDAFGDGSAGLYECYVAASWSDGNVTKHPDRDFYLIRVQADFQ